MASEELEGLGCRRLALLIEYDGTNYAGFQLQADQPTVQGQIERGLARFTGETIRIRGASRTDSGAHARGQVVDFLTSCSHPADRFPRALNFYLPPDIKVQASHQVPINFNSRRDAVSRIYRYQIWNRSCPSPLHRYTHFWVTGELDESKMDAAAQGLLGSHDFRILAPSHPADKSAVRHVYRWNAWREGHNIIIECEANAFLRHQIRKATAFLIEAGKGRCPESIMSDVLDGGLPSLVERPAVPANGLCLMEVKYPTPFNGSFDTEGSWSIWAGGDSTYQQQAIGAATPQT